MDTTVFSSINFIHVLVATLAYFMLGAIWYGPLFSKTWVHHHKVDTSDPNLKKSVAPIMLGSFVLFFVVTLALAVLIERLGFTQAISGVKLGIFTGVGFSAAAISITYLYLQKSPTLHLIEGLYHIIGQAIAAVILCVWR